MAPRSDDRIGPPENSRLEPPVRGRNSWWRPIGRRTGVRSYRRRAAHARRPTLASALLGPPEECRQHRPERGCPLLASTNAPVRSEFALRDVPLVWPNSAVSSRGSGSVEHFTLTKGPRRLRLLLCSTRAATSFPVPVSPVTRTVTLGARGALEHRAHLNDRCGFT